MARRVVGALTFVLLAACGARTGLETAAIGAPVDAGTGAPSDAGAARDAGRPPSIDAGRTDAGGGGRDAGPTPTSALDGAWVGPLVLGGFERRFTFVLHARATGDVLGYVAGGTSFRTVTSGRIDGDHLTLDVSHVDSRVPRMARVSGTVDGDRFVGTSDDGSGPMPITWLRASGPLAETRYRVAAAGGTPRGDIELALVTDEAGGFVSGGLVDRIACDVIVCGAGLTSFEARPVHEGPTTLIFGFASGCVTGTLTFTAAPAAPWRYTGSFSATGCDGAPISRALAMRVSTAAATDDALAMLRSLGAIADALEAGAPLPDGLPVSSAYLHDGVTREGLVAAMAAQIAGAGGLHVEMGGFRSVVSVRRPDTDPALDAPPGIEFRDRRTAASGAVVSDSTTDTDASLRYLTPEGGTWLVLGNQRPR